MKKLLVSCLIIALIISYTAAQEQEKTGLEKLIDSLDANTKAQNNAVKKIEDINPQLEEKFERWGRDIIGGVSIFIVLIFVLNSIYGKVMKLRRKITIERHIEKIEDRMQKNDKELVELYKKNIEEAKKEYRILLQNNRVLEYMIKNHADVKPKNRNTVYALLFLTGLILGVLL